jgi:hypothetical protein
MDGNGIGKIGTNFTFGLVLRGELEDINKLIEYLKNSNLTVAHQKISDRKMYLREDSDDN